MLLRLPGKRLPIHVAGSSDFLLQVVKQDLDTYADFAMTIVRRLPGIKAMQTILTLKEVKSPAPWPVPDAGPQALAMPIAARFR